MADMLVKLYALPAINPYLIALDQIGIEIRKSHPAEKYILSEWVRQHFADSSWAIGCEVALENRPVSCYLAVKQKQVPVPNEDPYELPDEVLIGFACYDVGHKGMFGPLGVHANFQQQGIGTALLLTCLHAMKAEGYVYAAIGWVASEEFYENAVGAIIIPDSEPGIFRGRLVGSVSQE